LASSLKLNQFSSTLKIQVAIQFDLALIKSVRPMGSMGLDREVDRLIAKILLIELLSELRIETQ